MNWHKKDLCHEAVQMQTRHNQHTINILLRSLHDAKDFKQQKRANSREVTRCCKYIYLFLRNNDKPVCDHLHSMICLYYVFSLSLTGRAQPWCLQKAARIVPGLGQETKRAQSARGVSSIYIYMYIYIYHITL